MDCKKPNGCPTPLECSGDGSCAAAEEFCCEQMISSNPQTMFAESFTFGEPIEMKVRRLEAQILELGARLDAM